MFLKFHLVLARVKYLFKKFAGLKLNFISPRRRRSFVTYTVSVFLLFGFHSFKRFVYVIFAGDSLLWTAKLRGDAEMWRRAQETEMTFCRKLDELYR